MLSDTPKLETSSNKIDFPASHDDTELLLGGMRQSYMIKVKDWTTAQRLLKICRQFDFALVGGSIASQLTPFVSEAPLRIFSIASQYNNIALARAALTSYDRIWFNNGSYPVDFSLATMGECSVPYLLGLADCIYHCQRSSNVITQEAWKSKVSSFMPKEK